VAESAPEPNPEHILPTLTPEQIARIAVFAHERTLTDGESLWSPGDRSLPLFVILQGEIEIVSGTNHLVTVHQPGGFTGDVDLLSGRSVVVGGRARGATRVLELPSERLRALVQTDSDLMEVFLRAFILRRLALVSSGEGNVVLIGSRHSAGTLMLQEFLTRNTQPYAYVDIDRDSGVQQTLDSFGVGVDDVPVLICRGKRVLKKPTIEEAG
jgi:thioredoxin reductase (NADPH)